VFFSLVCYAIFLLFSSSIITSFDCPRVWPLPDLEEGVLVVVAVTTPPADVHRRFFKPSLILHNWAVDAASLSRLLLETYIRKVSRSNLGNVIVYPVYFRGFASYWKAITV
jgi:hypothetical protein